MQGVAYQTQRGLTLIELMVVVALIALLAGLYLPAMHRLKQRGIQTRCLSNLRQVGLGLRFFADDHEGLYPMNVAMTAGGTKEYATNGQTWRHFQALSNHLDQPKVLICPADHLPAATNWTTFTNGQLSYFLGLDASMGNAAQMLSGDRNIVTDNSEGTSVQWLNTGEQVSWTQEMHNANGNVLFADNHVEMLSNEGLRRAVQRYTSTTR